MTSRTSNQDPEVLALTNFSEFIRLLWLIKQGRHEIKLGSPEHQRLRMIAALCNTIEPTNENFRCKFCEARALYVGVRSQNDGSAITSDYFCATHLSKRDHGIIPISLRIATPHNYPPGDRRRTLQRIVRHAYGFSGHITSEAARLFFDHLLAASQEKNDVQERKPPWWTET